MRNITVSKATHLHQAIILDILIETQNWLRAQGINQWTLPFEAEWVRESIASEQFFVAHFANEGVEPEKITAVFRLTSTDSMWEGFGGQALYIHSLAVRQQWKGHQIGKALLEWMAQYAVDRGVRFLRLDCLADNATLCRYYEAAGFMPVKRVKVTYETSSYTAQLFEKELLCPK